MSEHQAEPSKARKPIKWNLEPRPKKKSANIISVEPLVLDLGGGWKLVGHCGVAFGQELARSSARSVRAAVSGLHERPWAVRGGALVLGEGMAPIHDICGQHGVVYFACPRRGAAGRRTQCVRLHHHPLRWRAHADARENIRQQLARAATPRAVPRALLRLRRRAATLGAALSRDGRRPPFGQARMDGLDLRRR